MIEVRAFEGDRQELVDLINAAWQGRYLTRDMIPTYDAEVLCWQILDSPPVEPALHLAAYDGSRLVGCFLAQRRCFSYQGQTLEGSQGSWFSVHPDYASSGVGIKLVNALERAHRELDLAFFLGVVNASPTTPAYQFWGKYARAFPTRFQTLAPIHFWMRFLKPAEVAARMGHPEEAFGIRLLSLLQPRVRRRNRALLRDYHPKDLSGVLRLLQRTQQGLWQRWSEAELGHQLEGNPAQTLILEKQQIAGVANFCRYPMKGKGSIHNALIDLLAFDDLGFSERLQLLQGATERIAEQGYQMAFVPVFGFSDVLVFLASGYIPVPKVCNLISLFAQTPLDPAAIRTPLLFR